MANKVMSVWITENINADRGATLMAMHAIKTTVIIHAIQSKNFIQTTVKVSWWKYNQWVQARVGLKGHFG